MKVTLPSPEVIMNDKEFLAFVDDVSPRKDGVQQVFIAELMTILQLLWEIYSFFKAAGCFTKTAMRARVKAAMREPGRREQEIALLKLKARYMEQK